MSDDEVFGNEKQLLTNDEEMELEFLLDDIVPQKRKNTTPQSPTAERSFDFKYKALRVVQLLRKEGVLHTVSYFLQKHNLSIDELNSWVPAQPFTNQPHTYKPTFIDRLSPETQMNQDADVDVYADADIDIEMSI